jgi:AcrR family transcriptional regulator
VVEAGARILGSGGYAAFNTNRVARVAGVSIGTVYQYFPNKLALIDAIRARHFDEVLAVVAGALGGKKSWERRVDELLHGLVAVHRASPALHRALLEDAPATSRGNAAQAAFEVAYFDAFTALAASAARRKTADPSVTGRVLAAAVEGAVHEAARLGLLDERSFRDELRTLLLGFLRLR